MVHEVAAIQNAIQRYHVICDKKKRASGVSQVVQWLRLHASTAGGMGSIPGLGTKIPHAAWCGQKDNK